MIKKLLLIIVSILYCNYLSAQRENVVCDSVKIYFRQSKIDLVPSLNNNKAALDRIVDSLSTSYADSVYKLQKVLVVGGASPEGSVKFNKWLSEKRAGVLFDYISHYSPLPDSLMTTHFLGRDWNGLIRLVENDAEVPYREETLALLRKWRYYGWRPAGPVEKIPLRRTLLLYVPKFVPGTSRFTDVFMVQENKESIGFAFCSGIPVCKTL